MIYGFIVDEALQKWDDNTLLASQVDQGSGYASENVLEYFNSVGVVRDNRTKRYAYFGNNVTMYGRLGFLIDKNPPDSDGVINADEDSEATANDVLDYDNIGSDELKRIFNIIEDTLYYRSGMTTGNTITNFLNVRFSGSNSYTGYVVGSLELSSENSGDEVYIPELSATNSNKESVDADELSVPVWFKFSFKTISIGTVTFKLWVNKESFMDDYPYSTICEVVLPTAVKNLANPGLLTDGLSSVVDSGTFINSVYKTNLKDFEASGVTIFTTAYKQGTYTEGINIPFGIIYKGVAPNDNLIKKAVRAKLISEGEKLEPQLTENTWYDIFEDLFIASKFYLIPLFDNTYTTEGKTLEHGVSKYSSVLNALTKVFPAKDSSALVSHLEFVVHDATDLIISAIPDDGNDSDKWLKELLPTYLPVDATKSNWSLMNSSDQDFHELLADAITAARNYGSVEDNQLPSTMTTRDVECGTTTNSAERTFIFFSSHHVEYYLLPRSVYLTLVEE